MEFLEALPVPELNTRLFEDYLLYSEPILVRIEKVRKETGTNRISLVIRVIGDAEYCKTYLQDKNGNYICDDGFKPKKITVNGKGKLVIFEVGLSPIRCADKEYLISIKDGFIYNLIHTALVRKDVILDTDCSTIKTSIEEIINTITDMEFYITAHQISHRTGGVSTKVDISSLVVGGGAE